MIFHIKILLPMYYIVIRSYRLYHSSKLISRYLLSFDNEEIVMYTLKKGSRYIRYS